MKILALNICFIAICGIALTAQQDTATLNLFDLSFEELMQLKVTTASQQSQKITEAPASVEIITGEEIHQRGYTYLEEVLHDLPGFNFSKAHGINTSTIYQRGYRENNTDRTIFMIDGIPENDIWKGVVWLDKQYPLINIKRIEILYGPASALYGANAFQGIINVITKDGADNKALVNAYSGYGSYNTFISEISIGKKIKDFDFNLTFRKYNSHEMDLSSYPEWDYKIPEGAVFIFPLNKYENPKDDIGINWKLKHNGFTIGGVWWDRRDGSGSTYVDSYQVSDGTYYSDVTMTWNIQNMHLYTMYETEIFKNFNTRTRIGFMRHEHIDDSNDMYIINGNSTQLTFTYRHELSKSIWAEQQFSYSHNLGSWKNSMILGFEYKDAYIQGDYLQNDFLYTPGQPYPKIPEIEGVDIYDTRNIGVYFQDIVQPTKKLSITLGGRYDYNKIRHYAGFGGVFNPRIGLVYFPVPKINIKLLYGTGYSQVPNWTLFSTTDTRMANPNLSPEIVISKEMSVGYQIIDKIYIESSFFYNNYANKALLVQYAPGILDPANPQLTDRNEAIGKWTIWGTECRLKYIQNKFSAYLNYSFSNPYDEDNKEKIGNISHSANFVANYRLSNKIGINLRGNWMDERPGILRDSSGGFLDIIPSYLVFHSNLYFKDILVKGLGFSFSMNNIFNTEYFDPGMRTGSGKYPARLPQNRRNFFLKLSYNIL